MAYWILKTEPNTYSFEQLKKDKETIWDGVRNFQARNYIRSMKPGDEAMIYHSVGPREIVGLSLVVSKPFIDPTATKGEWYAVDIRYKSYLSKPIPLFMIKALPALANLSLVKQSRLSVCPVSPDEWETILSLQGS